MRCLGRTERTARTARHRRGSYQRDTVATLSGTLKCAQLNANRQPRQLLKCKSDRQRSETPAATSYISHRMSQCVLCVCVCVCVCVCDLLRSNSWQWPTWLTFWPDQARAALEYRVGLMAQAAENARHLDVYLHDFAPQAAGIDKHEPKRLEGIFFVFILGFEPFFFSEFLVQFSPVKNVE